MVRERDADRNIGNGCHSSAMHDAGHVSQLIAESEFQRHSVRVFSSNANPHQFVERDVFSNLAKFLKSHRIYVT